MQLSPARSASIPFFAWLLALSAIAGSQFAIKAQASEVDSQGHQIDAFTLPDVYGNEVSLEDFKDSRAVVVCFLGTECPLAKFYGPRLQAFSEQFADQGVAFIGINSNIQDSLEEIAAYARKHGIKFPILKDLRSKVAEQFRATRTPEVFVLDAERTVRYSGRVDGQFTFGSGVGLATPNEARADLRIAIEEMLAGKPVSEPKTVAKGCLIGHVKEVAEKPTVTYTKQIARLVQDNCQECHREGQIAPFAMDNYEDVAGWGDMMAEVIREQRMPPWHAGKKSTASFQNDTSLSDEEKQLVYQWVEDGCPEGNPSDLPAPKEFSNEWFTKGGFDEVIRIAEQAVPVKAQGIEPYRYYEVAGQPEDRWVKVAECLPGNREVVHHIIVYARPPGGKPIPPGAIGIDTKLFSWVAGYAPGTRPLELPEGWARLIPADYSLVFEMHYTPVGTAATDLSGLGLVLTDAEDVKRVSLTDLAINAKFEIPPHDPNYRVEADKPFKRDTTVLALFPHMHVRGKSFRYELTYPDGRQEILLDVPSYDFNWQNNYVFEKPMVIPKGSKLHCTAYFDNSDGNLANPDPGQKVTWGSQSWEEMMIGFFEVGITEKEARYVLQQQAKKLKEEWAKREREQQVSLNSLDN